MVLDIPFEFNILIKVKQGKDTYFAFERKSLQNKSRSWLLVKLSEKPSTSFRAFVLKMAPEVTPIVPDKMH